MPEDDSGPLDWTSTWSYLPHAVLGGLAVGAGGRLAKNLYDLASSDPTQPRTVFRPGRAAVSNVPIEVTPEEAEELARRGIKVRKVLAKRASDASPWKAMGYGALGTAATLGGWKLTDMVIDRLRKQQAKKEVSRVKDRIRRLIEGNPLEEDVTVYRRMKTASAAHSVKTAVFGMGSLRDLLTVGGLGVGSAAVLQLLAGARKAQSGSASSGTISQLKKTLARRRARPASAAMTPVIIEREKDRDEEELRNADLVEVVPQSGSPSDQAEAHSGSWF